MPRYSLIDALSTITVKKDAPLINNVVSPPQSTTRTVRWCLWVWPTSIPSARVSSLCASSAHKCLIQPSKSPSKHLLRLQSVPLFIVVFHPFRDLFSPFFSFNTAVKLFKCIVSNCRYIQVCVGICRYIIGIRLKMQGKVKNSFLICVLLFQSFYFIISS